MSASTIIIESNRKIAYDEELKALDGIGVDNVERQERISNNRWKTHIPSGIAVEVGDQINLEAAMINSVGGGDSVMEFTGKGGNKGTDLQMNLEMSYYITNRQQFNFNLPMFGMRIISEVYNDFYGTPDFEGESAQPLSTDPIEKSRQQYNQFKKSYPLEGLQGYSVQVGPESGNGTQLIVLPNASISNGSYGNFDSNPTRLYYSEEWTGPIITFDETNKEYSKFTKDVVLNVPKGFSTPAAIGERLTSQLHNREGNANDWTLSTVNPSQFFLQNGVLNVAILPGITDQSYLTIPTCSGSLLYGRQSGKWSALLKSEGSGDEGDGYIPKQGRNVFWSNMLCGNPDEVRACDILKGLNIHPAITPDITLLTIESLNLDTGFVQKYVNAQQDKVGEFGNRMCLNQNDLPFQLRENLSWVQSVTTTKTNVVPQNPTTPIPIAVLNVPKNYAIVTNVIFNDFTTNIMNDSFIDFHSLDETTESIDMRDPAYISSFYVRWKIGRKDDETTQNIIAQQHYLTNAFLYDAGKLATPPNIYDETVWNVPEGSLNPVPTSTQNCSYILTSCRTHQDATVRENRPCLPGFIFNNSTYDYEIFIRYYSDNDWTPEKAQQNILGIGGLFPDKADSEWTTVHPNGLSAQKAVWAKMGNMQGQPRYGYIPVYRVPSGGSVFEASPIPYMCFVTQKEIIPGSKPIPKPVRGEFIGLSPSMNDNLFSKPVNIQKFTPASNSNTGGYDQTTNNDTVNYYPFCHIGANDPSIAFGDNGRFEISQFHTSIRSGNGIFNLPKYPESQTPETNICQIGSRDSNISGVAIDSNTPPSVITTPFTSILSFGEGNNFVMSVQSGMSIETIANYTEDLKNQILIQNFDTRGYRNTLFYKLGFDLEQIHPLFGGVQNEFNRGNYNKYLGVNQPAGKKLSNMVKPFTTNGYISSAIVPSLIRGAGFVQDNQSPANVISRPLIPMPNLGGLSDFPTETNIESDVLIALRMPQKLDYPYLVVYTDIVRNPQYIGGSTGHQKLSAIAYITRNYAEGDFFYSFSTGWTYTADSNYIITDIMTDIRLPDGSPAPLDSNSSVIYKLIKPKQMPVNLNMPPKPIDK